MNAPTVSLRRLRDDGTDYCLLARWCRQEEVYRYFEQRILTDEEIVAKYRPRTAEDAAVPVWMIEYDQRPAGIIQYARMDEDDGARCGIDADDSYEVDLFIGETNLYGQGIGRESVSLMARYLFEEKSARMLVMCPLASNLRAVQCYLNCGFEENGRFSAPDTVGIVQDYVCMIRKNPCME